MDEIYELVKAGKVRQGITSDRGYALANDIHPQVIADLKAGKCMPNAENMLKILAAAGKDVNDGIRAIKKQKEAGFADAGLLAAIGAGSLGAMSLSGVTPSPEMAIGAGVVGAIALCIHYAKEWHL